MRSNISRIRQRHFDEERLFKILYKPLVSEKSTLASSKLNQVIFKVAPDATKLEITAAMKLVFGVDVTKVGMLNAYAKIKRRGKVTGRRKNWKKAYIHLKEGQSLGLGE